MSTAFVIQFYYSRRDLIQMKYLSYIGPVRSGTGRYMNMLLQPGSGMDRRSVKFTLMRQKSARAREQPAETVKEECYMRKHGLSSAYGFSLGELLITVAVIAVLTVIAIPVFASSLEGSREAADIANMRSAKAAAEDMIFSGRGPGGEMLDDVGVYCYFDAASGSIVGEMPAPYGKGTSMKGGCEDFCLITDPLEYFDREYYRSDNDVEGCVLEVYLNDSGVHSLRWVNEDGETRAGTEITPVRYAQGFRQGRVYTYSQLVEAFRRGGTFYLEQDIAIPASGSTLVTNPDSPSGITLKLYLQGHTISAKKPMRLIENASRNRLDIDDTAGGGSIVGADGSFDEGGGTLIANHGTMYIGNITLTNGHNSSDAGGGAIYSDGKMFGTTGKAVIVNCTASRGAALVLAEDCQCTLSGLTVRDCSSENDGDICITGKRGVSMTSGGVYACTFYFSAAQKIGGASGACFDQDISGRINMFANYYWLENDLDNGLRYRVRYVRP